MYAFTENFVLPLSHDEVVHGKGSLLAKMPGDRWQQYANLRLLLCQQYTQPGKKLLFMGAELAQASEWDHDGGLHWPDQDDELATGISRLVGDLNRLYRDHPALHVSDTEPNGFEWAVADDATNSVLGYFRSALDSPQMLIVHNLTPVPRPDYRVGVPLPGRWAELLNSDARIYGGTGSGNLGGVTTGEPSVPSHGNPESLVLSLPPLASVVLAAEPL
jgi:1,4-alpha-glucan branching enzyme